MKSATVIRAMRAAGYVVHEQPHRLNIVGLRSPHTRAGRFDDRIMVFFRDHEGKWRERTWAATTDPGTYWLHSPMHPQGTLILEPGQYDSYELGLHRGQYPGLVQRRGPVRIRRDFNRDDVLDFKSGTVSEGYYGANIHRANRTGTTQEVDRHSAGCQVLADAGDYEEFMDLCRRHRDLHGNAFVYTLFDFRRMQRKDIAVKAASGGAVLMGGLLLLPFIRDLFNREE